MEVFTMKPIAYLLMLCFASTATAESFTPEAGALVTLRALGFEITAEVISFNGCTSACECVEAAVTFVRQQNMSLTEQAIFDAKAQAYSILACNTGL